MRHAVATCLMCLTYLEFATPWLQCLVSEMPAAHWPVAGMAFAKHNNRGIIHLYRWTAENTRVADTRLEIDAHENGVNDLALTNLDGSLVAVSGGGDCKVKVWSATLGQLMFCFTGAVQQLRRVDPLRTVLKLLITLALWSCRTRRPGVLRVPSRQG